MPLGSTFTRHRGRHIPAWWYGLAGLLAAVAALRAATTFGSPAFHVGRAAVLVAVAVGLAWAARRWRTGAGAGWRHVLLPFAATALYRAAVELWRVAAGQVPAWFLVAGLPLVVWILVAGARGAAHELRGTTVIPRAP